MEIRHRISDIKDLQVLILQDYFLLGVNCLYPNDSWKKTAYDYINDKIKKKQYVSSFIGTWKKIQYMGMDDYSIQEMDTTIIIALHQEDSPFMFLKSVLPILSNLRDDRNENGHTDVHETTGELIGWAYCSLTNLDRLLKEVSNSTVMGIKEVNQKTIDPIEKRNFIEKYRSKIRKLRSGLEEDYQDAVACDAMIKFDVNSIVSDGKSFRRWSIVYPKYLSSVDGQWDTVLHFKFLKASAEAGITFAYSSLGMIYFDELCKNQKFGIPSDYEKAAYWLKKSIDSGDDDLNSKLRLAAIYMNGKASGHTLQEGEKLLANCREQCEKSRNSVLVKCDKIDGVSYYSITTSRNRN